MLLCVQDNDDDNNNDEKVEEGEKTVTMKIPWGRTAQNPAFKRRTNPKSVNLLNHETHANFVSNCRIHHCKSSVYHRQKALNLTSFRES